MATLTKWPQKQVVKMATRKSQNGHTKRSKWPHSRSQIVEDFLPEGFLCGDVIVKDERHLLFASERQLSLLAIAQHWFLDGTFKIVKDPFYQLLSVHAFLKVGSQMKMVPLFFAIMSRRRKIDYVKVFRQMIESMPHPPQVKVITMDFEAATWRAMEIVLPATKLRGCVFHLTQAIWRKFQEIGLQNAYRKNQGIFKFVKKLMALPFLPPSNIKSVFRCLQSKATTPGIKTLCTYFDRQWIKNSIFPVTSWSVYNQSVRTNSHVEGWNRRINSRNQERQLGLYKLVPALFKEAEQVTLQVRLLHEGKLRRYVRQTANRAQEEIFASWRLFKEGNLSPAELLSICSNLNGPSHEDD